MATLAMARDAGSLLSDGSGLEVFACEICAKTFTKRRFNVSCLRSEEFRPFSPIHVITLILTADTRQQDLQEIGIDSTAVRKLY
jgi:hypothetical protein